MKRELYIKEIVEEFSILKNKIDLLSGMNLRDLNLIAEYHIQEILNIIYSYSLINSNSLKSNAVAIDLQDEENRIAVQVTSTAAREKIQQTLDKFAAADLQKRFDILLIVILGKRQRSYADFRVAPGVDFKPSENILDFDKILSQLSTLPTIKIEKIRNLLKNDRLSRKGKTDPVARFKKNNAISKSLAKLVHKGSGISELEMFFYAPYLQFIYASIVIRSVADRTFPNITQDWEGPIAPWYKSQLHDFYEHGLEVVAPYFIEIVYDKNYNWNYLGERDKASLPAGIKVTTSRVIHRLPYDSMEKLDMDPDVYTGYPSLYLDYRNLNDFEEIPFLIGYYNDEANYGRGHYFEHSERDCSL